MRQLGPVWARLRLLIILALTIGLLFPSFPIFGVGGATGAAAANDASVSAVVNGAASTYTINFSQTATCNGTQGCATFTVSGLQPGETETITFKLTYHVPGNQTFMDTGLTKDVTVSANSTIYTICFDFPSEPGANTYRIEIATATHTVGTLSNPDAKSLSFSCNGSVSTATPTAIMRAATATSTSVPATATATTRAATATSTSVPATATATTRAATATSTSVPATATATTRAATATSTSVPATATATGAETGQARIAVFKSLCKSIGNQNTCNGRDTSLDGYRINFNVYEGTGTSDEQVDTIPVILGTNANGTGNVGNGSEGRTVGTATLATGGTYTVCEVPQATKAGSPTVDLLAVPRPIASQGGSSGGSNQTLFGTNCIVVTLTSGESELKFLDTIAAVAATPTATTGAATATPTATTGAATATSTSVPATTTATTGATTATPTVTTGASTATSTTVPATATATTGAATATPTVPTTVTSPVSTATPTATATGTSAPTSPNMTVTTQPSGSTQTTATATTGSNASGNTNNQATGGTTTTSNSSTSTSTLVTQGAPLTGASSSQPAAANQTTQPVTAPTRISEAQPLTGGPSVPTTARVTEAQPLTGGPSVRNDYRVTEAQPLTGGFVPGLPRTGGGYASHQWTMVAGTLVLVSSVMLLLILKVSGFRHMLRPQQRD